MQPGCVVIAYAITSVVITLLKGVTTMKHSKDMKNAHDQNNTGAIDEGRNQTTRVPYTDSISVPASENTLKKNKKNKRK